MPVVRKYATYLSAIAFIVLGASDSHAQIDEVTVPPQIQTQRFFMPGPFGQMHIRIAKPQVATKRTPLVLFHPTPYSSDYFASFMRKMSADRVVIAMDTPGYGDSDRPGELQDIAGYAQSAALILKDMGYGLREESKSTSASVDVLGYHTGALIAAELAAERPDLVRKAVLPGLPFYMGAERKAAYERNAVPDKINPDGSHLIPKWDFASGATSVGLTLERAQAHFNDMMQCYPHCWEAYHAVFTYESEIRFIEVKQPVLLITNDGSLKKESVAAMSYFPNSTLEHLDGVTLGGFDLAEDRYAEMIRAFLNKE